MKLHISSSLLSLSRLDTEFYLSFRQVLEDKIRRVSDICVLSKNVLASAFVGEGKTGMRFTSVKVKEMEKRRRRSDEDSLEDEGTIEGVTQQ